MADFYDLVGVFVFWCWFGIFGEGTVFLRVFCLFFFVVGLFAFFCGVAVVAVE